MVGIIILLSVALAYGVPTTTINTPNSFTPNTTIDSSDMNDNFNEVQTEFNNHSHDDITSLGAVTTGSWLGTPVGTTYGGTGKNFGAAAVGSMIYFSNAGIASELVVGTNGQAIVSNGTIPAWTTVGGANDMITRGLELDYAGTTGVIASSGVVYVGSTVVNSATSFTLTLATAGCWASGSVVSYAGGAGWCYVGVNQGGKIRLLGNVAPNICDVSGNLQGTKYYLQQTDTGGTGNFWRVIGAFRVAITDTVERSWTQQGNTIFWDSPISLFTNVGANTNQSCAATIPGISKIGIFSVHMTSSLNNVPVVKLRPYGTGGYPLVVSTGGAGDNEGELQGNCPISNSQVIDYISSAADTIRISSSGYYLNIR